MVALVIRSLRDSNQGTEFFWTGDPLPSGSGWFQHIEDTLRAASGVISIITNNSTGTNNWINFEIGAAVGGSKALLIVYAPGISVPFDFSLPLQQIQLVGWSDRVALANALNSLGLQASNDSVESLVSAFAPPSIIAIRYGTALHLHEFTPVQRAAFTLELENRKQIVIGNHLIDNLDPEYGVPKTISFDIKRNERHYTLTFPEQSLVRRSDLYQ